MRRLHKRTQTHTHQRHAHSRNPNGDEKKERRIAEGRKKRMRPCRQRGTRAAPDSGTACLFTDYGGRVGTCTAARAGTHTVLLCNVKTRFVHTTNTTATTATTTTAAATSHDQDSSTTPQCDLCHADGSKLKPPARWWPHSTAAWTKAPRLLAWRAPTKS